MKLYESYFPKFNLVSGENVKEPVIIMSHSIGVVDALVWIRERKVKKYTFVAMDPPIMGRMITSEDKQLEEKYKKFVEIANEIDYDKVQVYRNSERKELVDRFTNVIYYEHDTHYPYQVKRIRDQIIDNLK